MSEIHSTDHKSITDLNFPDEGFHEADSEFVESEKIIVPGSVEYRKDFFFRIQDHQTIQSNPLKFLQLPFRIRNLILKSERFLEVSIIKSTSVPPNCALWAYAARCDDLDRWYCVWCRRGHCEWPATAA